MRVLVLLLPLAAATFREQSTGAKGFVSCRGVRQPGVFVQLFDEDSIFPFDSDDLMGSTTADGLGHFCVKGTTSEVTDIEPYIFIEHNCGYEGLDQKTNFFYYLSKEYIVEGNTTRKIEHLGEIELLANDAPVQDYKKKYHHHRHLAHSQRERIDQCIPLYVTYKDFFETEVFGIGKDVIKQLDQDDDGLLQVEETPIEPVVTDKEVIDLVEIHEDIKRIEHLEEDNAKKLEEETRRLEEERVRLEEERVREEELERQRQEENRRREEDERRKDEERRREEERMKAEEDRLKEEERRKQEYEKAMEDYRRREEERRQEILRREEESSRTKEKLQTSVSLHYDEEDDPCYRRIKRGVRLDASDPCYRRLRG